MITIKNVLYCRYDNIALKDLLAKHVHAVDSDKAKVLLNLSLTMKYNTCRWGSVSKNFSEQYQLNKIKKMDMDNVDNAIRIVVCKYPFSDEKYLWTDNLHTTIRHIRNNGIACKLNDIKYYIIEVENGVATRIINIRNSFSSSLGFGSVESAIKRYKYSENKTLIALRYTVGDFLEENNYLLF